jgi:serine/threonine protein kinase
MEYFPCGDLRDRLRNPLSVDESLYYLRAIAEALRVIHVFGILHRDLKPANVMLREDNSPVLIDFGLARRSVDEAAPPAPARCSARLTTSARNRRRDSASMRAPIFTAWASCSTRC